MTRDKANPASQIESDQIARASAQRVGLDFDVIRRFLYVTEYFWSGPGAWRGISGLVGVAAVIFLGSWIEGKQSYLHRSMLDHLAARQYGPFASVLAWSAITLIAIESAKAARSYSSARLVLFWRQRLTHDFLDRYLRNRAYYRLSQTRTLDNPDERIAEDGLQLTKNLLNSYGDLVFALTNTAIFLPILLSIAPTLVPFLLLYGIAGSAFVAWLFGSMTQLDALQSSFEADLRYSITRVRTSAESIACYRGEQAERSEIDRRFGYAFRNTLRLLARKVGREATEAIYLAGISVVPMILVSPRYFRHEIDLGAILQVGTATFLVTKTFSFAIHYYPELTLLASEVNRLYDLKSELDGCDGSSREPSLTSEEHPSDALLRLDRVDIRTPTTGLALIRELSFELPRGMNLLVTGPSGSGKTSLLRAIAGLWKFDGVIQRPPADQVIFLPQRPYIVHGSLREQIVYPRVPEREDDERILEILEFLGLAHLEERSGGLNVPHPWRTNLSVGEQQRIGFARLLYASPVLAVLDEASSALDPEMETVVYQALESAGISYVSVGHCSSLLAFHDLVLELRNHQAWTLCQSAELVDQFL